MGDELGADDGQGAHAHVDHHGLVGPRQRRPVERDGALALFALQMAGGKHQHGGMVTVCEGNARSRCGALGRTDARHGVTGNAGGCQRLGLFAAAPEDIRITALQAHQRAAALRQPHHEFDDAFLRQGVVAALLADVDAFSSHSDMPEHIAGHQVVIKHQIGTGKHACRLEREQLRVTGPRAHQSDTAPFRRREPGKNPARRGGGCVAEGGLRGGVGGVHRGWPIETGHGW